MKSLIKHIVTKLSLFPLTNLLLTGKLATKQCKALSMVCATSRMQVLISALEQGRAHRAETTKLSLAATVIAKFYRTQFMFVNFRRHKRMREALGRHFQVTHNRDGV